MAKEQRGRCFYCSLLLREDMTWEHLVARSHRGTNSIKNMRVAHSKCNSEVGVLHVDVKYSLHEIGWTLGSDAFFLLASRLKAQANSQGAHSSVPIKRRPKRQPPDRHRAQVDRLLCMLPEGFVLETGIALAA